MHYYKRNLGDYAKKAGRLSMLQHGAYTLLIDACYDREQFPTVEEAIEWTWASTAEEEEAVRFVLRKFFVLDGDVYIQKRIQEELDDYFSKAQKNKQIAIDRETKRKREITNRAEKSTNRERTVHEPPPNHKPITKNHKPITNSKDLSKSDAFDRESAFAEFWEAYPRSEGKKLAQTKFKQVCKDPATFADVMFGLREQVPKIREIKFFPHATTWLNGERWKDQPPESGVSSVVDKFVNMEARHG